jgi:hypothetical protein
MNNAPKLTCRIPSISDRAGRCFELSGSGCLQAGGTWTLIHGEVDLDVNTRMAHAWLERKGWVYDPVLDQTVPRDVYVKHVNAIVFRRFNVREASKQMLNSGHYGPWPVQSPITRTKTLPN